MHPILPSAQLAAAALRASANGATAVTFNVRTSLAGGLTRAGIDDRVLRRSEGPDSAMMHQDSIEDSDELVSNLLHREELLYFSCGDIDFEVSTKGADDSDRGDEAISAARRGRGRSAVTVFDGRAVLNPGFMYESAHELEIMLEFGQRPWRPTTADTEFAMLLAREVATLAAKHGDAPIVFMHLPAAPYREERKSDRSHGQLETVRDTHALCLRMAVAFMSYQTEQRLKFLDGVGRLASEWHVGLLVGDQRPGRIRGEWITVRSLDVEAFAERRESLGMGDPARVVARGLPVTIVGPARIGSSAAILSGLQDNRIGLIGMSVTAMQELAFINLVIDATDIPFDAITDEHLPLRQGLEAIVNAAMCEDMPDEEDSVTRNAELVTTYSPSEEDPGNESIRLDAAVDEQRPSPERPCIDVTTDLQAAADYSVLFGSSYPLRVDSDEPAGRPLWIVWDMPFGTADLDDIFRTLHRVLSTESESYVVQYARARLGGTGRIRGRAKVSVQIARKRFKTEGIRNHLRKLGERVEQEIRVEIAKGSGLAEAEVRVRVMWRERWLGGWDAPL